MSQYDIVGRLRKTADSSRSKHDLLTEAADLIETLQAELTEARRTDEELRQNSIRYDTLENVYPIEYKHIMEDLP